MARMSERELEEIASQRYVIDMSQQTKLAKEVMRLRRQLAGLHSKHEHIASEYTARKDIPPYGMGQKQTYRSGPMEAVSELEESVNKRCTRLDDRVTNMEKRWLSMEQRFAAHNIITANEDAGRGRMFASVGLVLLTAMCICIVAASIPSMAHWLRAACTVGAATTMLGGVVCVRRAIAYWPTPRQRRQMQEDSDVRP